MREFYCKLVVNISVPIIAVMFLIMNYLYPDISTLFLSIELVILPSIYVIGNQYSERIMAEDHQGLLSFISSEADKLTAKYQESQLENQILKYNNTLLRHELENGKKTRT